MSQQTPDENNRFISQQSGIHQQVENTTLEGGVLAIQGDSNTQIQADVLTFNHTEILQVAFETIKNRALITASPYKGLKKFEPEDKDLFFGRDQFITGLVRELEETNLVLLLGASGSGKSSVVRAGLIPWLAQNRGTKFVKLMFTPDSDPFESLYGSLLNKYKQNEAQIAKTGKGDTLVQVIKQLKQPDEYWLIFIDQFEELFTSSQLEKSKLFIEALVELHFYLNKNQQKAVKVLGTIRADFLDKLSPYDKLVKIIDKHKPMIAEMGIDELRLAIEQPAAHRGVIFENGLVERIIKEVQGQAGYLPLLQYTLDLLWEEEVRTESIADRTLNISIYESLGGVKGALEKRANEIYTKLTKEEQLAAQRIFLKLVDISKDTASGTESKSVRRRVLKSVFTDEVEQKVLKKLIDANLLVSDSQFQAQKSNKSKELTIAKEATIDIAHEILLTSWQDLNSWIEKNKYAIELRNRLEKDAKDWQEKKRAEDELWSGSKLEQVLELKEEPNFKQVMGGFSPAANEFIDASVGRREQLRRRTILGLAGFSTVALILAGFAGWQWKRVEKVQLGQSDALSQYSHELFNQNEEFYALIASLQAATPLKRANAQPSMQVVAALLQAVYGQKERPLEGHSDNVFSVAFSPDGKTLASASKDSTIKLWNLQTLSTIATLYGHSKEVNSVAFSPDGKTLASASYDGTIKLWNLQTKTTIATLEGHSKQVFSVAFSPDGKTLASASFDKTIKLWNLQTKTTIAILKGHSDILYSVAFSPDGKTLASASFDKTIKLWNLQTLSTITTLKGHSDMVRSVAFSPDGKTLASASDDKTIKLWNLQTLSTITTLKGHSDMVFGVAFSPDGKTLASASRDNTIKLWNLQTLSTIATLKGHSNYVYSVAFSPDGKTLASASHDNTIKLWNLQTQPTIATLKGHSNEVASVAFSPDGKTLASASHDNTIKLWNLQTQPTIATLKGHSKEVVSVAFSPDGKTLASASSDGIIKLWNLQTLSTIATLKGHSEAVNSVAFSPDGKTLASASYDNTIKLWNLQTLSTIATLKGHRDAVNSVAFSPDGKTLAFASRGSIKLWNLQTLSTIATLEAYSNWVFSVAFSPDGKTLASASDDRAIKLWNLQTLSTIATLKGHSHWVFSVAFSPDGKTLASASKDSTIKLWNLQTLSTIATLKGHSKGVTSVAFSPDGKTLASASIDNTIILWNFDFDDLLKRGCDWARGYLENSPNVSDSDRHLCDGIPSSQ